MLCKVSVLTYDFFEFPNQPESPEYINSLNLPICALHSYVLIPSTLRLDRQTYRLIHKSHSYRHVIPHQSVPIHS